jgi:transposase
MTDTPDDPRTKAAPARRVEIFTGAGCRRTWSAEDKAGIVARVGRNGVIDLLDVVADTSDRRLPEVARECLAALGIQLRMLKAQILEFDRRIMPWHRSNETSKRLDEIPGVGPALATAPVASVADPKAFAAHAAPSARCASISALRGRAVRPI